MKSLYLLRHGTSPWLNRQMPDDHRELNEQGRQESQKISRYFRDLGNFPHLILCSTAKRTQQTCHEVLSLWDDQPKVIMDPKLYLASQSTLLSLLAHQDYDGYDAIMMIGHNTGIHKFACALIGQFEQKDAQIFESYYPATLSLIEFQITSWSQLDWKKGILNQYICAADL